MAGGLVAVLLLTRSRPGPKLVFHYPLVPDVYSSLDEREDQSDDSSSDSSEDDQGHTALNASNGVNKPNRSAPGENANSSLGSLFGYSIEVLERLLSPGRWSDRKKFEICLDGLTFVGHPVYAREDGTWSGKQDSRSFKEPRTPHSDTSVAVVAEDEHEAVPSTAVANITITEPQTPAKPNHDFTHIPESLDSQGGTSLGTSFNSTSTASAIAAEQMTMFHVVFVLAQEASNSRVTAAKLYEHIAKKLSKALLYCQKQTSYISTESRRLLALKAKVTQEQLTHAALWAQLIDGSELAWALKELYMKLSNDKVACIRLNGMEMSLQIPLEDADEHANATVDPHSAILLLDDKTTILRELSHPEASPLAHFISEQTPTKTLQKHATLLNMPINNILYLARHLVKWRKARVVAPLHPRNTYIVAPEAPLDLLAEQTNDYARHFPALPSLTKILSMLSAKPVRFGMLIPSRDHKAPYMEVLAYLLRANFAAQLKTFGWLKWSEHVKVGQSRDDGVLKAIATSGRAPSVSLLSPHLRPNDGNDISVSSDQTAIRLAQHDRSTTQVGDAKLEQEEQSIRNDPYERSVVLTADPMQRTKQEDLYIDAVLSSITDEEFQVHFHSVFRYLDGEHAFEEIAYRLGLKRAKVEAWLDHLKDQGLLLVFQAT